MAHRMRRGEPGPFCQVLLGFSQLPSVDGEVFAISVDGGDSFWLPVAWPMTPCRSSSWFWRRSCDPRASPSTAVVVAHVLLSGETWENEKKVARAGRGGRWRGGGGGGGGGGPQGNGRPRGRNQQQRRFKDPLDRPPYPENELPENGEPGAIEPGRACWKCTPTATAFSATPRPTTSANGPIRSCPAR